MKAATQMRKLNPDLAANLLQVVEMSLVAVPLSLSRCPSYSELLCFARGSPPVAPSPWSLTSQNPHMPCQQWCPACELVKGSLQVFNDSLKAPNCKPLCSFVLLVFCGEAFFLARLCPQLPGQGWASCRWWNLQSLLLRRCTKRSCEVEMTSDRRCAFASWM